MTRCQPSRRRQAGMSLIEVLTAVLIFSIGILGLVGLHARATQFSVSAEDTNRAALLANEMVTAVWLNRPAVGSARFCRRPLSRHGRCVSPTRSPEACPTGPATW